MTLTNWQYAEEDTCRDEGEAIAIWSPNISFVNKVSARSACLYSPVPVEPDACFVRELNGTWPKLLLICTAA